MNKDAGCTQPKQEPKTLSAELIEEASSLMHAFGFCIQSGANFMFVDNADYLGGNQPALREVALSKEISVKTGLVTAIDVQTGSVALVKPSELFAEREDAICARLSFIDGAISALELEASELSELSEQNAQSVPTKGPSLHLAWCEGIEYKIVINGDSFWVYDPCMNKVGVGTATRRAGVTWSESDLPTYEVEAVSARILRSFE